MIDKNYEIGAQIASKLGITRRKLVKEQVERDMEHRAINRESKIENVISAFHYKEARKQNDYVFKIPKN